MKSIDSKNDVYLSKRDGKIIYDLYINPFGKCTALISIIEFIIAAIYMSYSTTVNSINYNFINSLELISIGVFYAFLLAGRFLLLDENKFIEDIKNRGEFSKFYMTAFDLEFRYLWAKEINPLLLAIKRYSIYLLFVIALYIQFSYFDKYIIDVKIYHIVVGINFIILNILAISLNFVSIDEDDFNKKYFAYYDNINDDMNEERMC